VTVTATLAERAELRAFTDDELAGLYTAGDEDTRADVLAECERRDAARGKARQARQAVQAAWYDAAHAAMLQAEADCKGVLFSAYGREHGPSDAMGLWSGSEAQARKWASEELNLWWDRFGRLTVTAYTRQVAGDRRRERAERFPEGKPRRKRRDWAGVQGGAVCETPVRLGTATVTAWAAMAYDSDEVTVHPTRAHAERHLAPPEPEPAPEPETVPVPAPEPPMPGVAALVTGTVAERLAALAEFEDYLTTARQRRAERRAALMARLHK
jgi:hypothetical protein